MAATLSRTRRAARRIQRTWAELEYAQRRLFEIRTGVTTEKGARSRVISDDLQQLEQLYRLPPA